MKRRTQSQKVFADQPLAAAVRRGLLGIGLLGLAANGTALADYPAVIELSELDGSNGFTLNGINAPDSSGRSVSSAGDVNGDGFDDLILGAPYASPNGYLSGQSYVVFGGLNVGSGGTLELSALDGRNGFALNGVASSDYCGESVSGAGDVNGDGVDDVIIGALRADPNGDDSGQSYVIFGGPNVGSGGTLELSALDGRNGFALSGINEYDHSGGSVSGTGDVNGDGVDDLVVSASGAYSGAGQIYVVFGGLGVGNGGVLELSALDGRNGFAVNGINAFDHSGGSVSGAGDVNSDGADDLIIGAPLADPNLSASGQSYVVFGGPGVGSRGVLELSALDGSNGFALNGINAGDQSGFSVSGAGDVNGDGIADIIVSALGADPNGDRSGQSYVVFGGPGVGNGGVLEFSALDGRNGFALNGINEGDDLGWSVSGVGDINGDGVGDLILGAPFADPNGEQTGQTYVVFGGPVVGRDGALELSALDGSNGFALNGIPPGGLSGWSVSGAGDINGDGVYDVVIGATSAVSGSGQSYVVFGRPYSSTPSFAALRSLRDTNGDGTPEIAVVARAGGNTLATVKDAADGSLVSQFEFSADLRPVDVEVVMDGFGLVLLGDGPPTGETRDVLGGGLYGSTAFSVKFSPVDLTVAPDQNGNGIPELGMLGQGSTKVELRDAVTGDLVNNLWFDPLFQPRQVITLPDLNGNGSAEIGVVLANAEKTDRVVVKDTLTKEQLRALKPGWNYRTFELLQALPVSDKDGNGAAEVAMLLRDSASGETLVWVADAATGARVAKVAGFNPAFIPVKLVEVADLNGNGADEAALLARNPDTAQVTVEVRDGRSSKRISRLWFSKDCTPLDLATIADINGNGAEEVVLLQRCADGQLKAVVKDAGTGERLNILKF